MRFKTTLIWGIALLLLAGFVYYYEVKGGRERKQAEEEAKRVFVFDDPKINQLELSYDDKHIRCVKSEDGTWQMLEPFKFSGDKPAIQRIIDTLSRATIERKLGASNQDISGFGLDKPKLKLKLASKDEEYLLLLGDDNPMGGLMYAQRGDDPAVLLLHSSLRYGLKKDVFDLRDKRVIRVAEAKVNQIELDYPQRRLVLTNNPQAGWQITSPDKLKADPYEISSLIRQVNSMRVKEFVAETADELSSFGLDKPKLTLTLHAGEDQAQRRLLLGNQDTKKQGVYAKRVARPQIMLLDTTVVSELTKEVFDLRERRILRFDTVSVNELELGYPEHRMQFKREDEEWRMIEPEEAPAKGYLLESMLYDLQYLKAKRFIEGEPKPGVNYGWDKPQVRVSLKAGYGKQANTLGLLIGAQDKQDEGLVYVKRDDGKVFAVSKGIVEQLTKQPTDLKRDVAKGE